MLNLFRFEPAEDYDTDSQYVYLKNENITVQDARSYGGGYAVNEMRVEDAETVFKYHGAFKTRKAAFEKVVAIA